MYNIMHTILLVINRGKRIKNFRLECMKVKGDDNGKDRRYESVADLENGEERCF